MNRHGGAYPDNWPEIARATKEEAGWSCVRCGHPDPPDSKPRGKYPCGRACTHDGGDPSIGGKQRVLTVHHFDGDKAQCRFWNLAALCQVCHLQVQAKIRNVDQHYMHAHTEWFRPYVAGYYAWTILAEDLSREEVESRMLELLEIGQPHVDYRSVPRGTSA